MFALVAYIGGTSWAEGPSDEIFLLPGSQQSFFVEIERETSVKSAERGSFPRITGSYVLYQGTT
jgi:hypothetical protein